MSKNPRISTSVGKVTEDVILTVDQPDTNHNGGDLSLGPDNVLYVGFGGTTGKRWAADVGQGVDGELYVLHFGGTIHQIAAAP